ncbi:MAG: hypothetical protein NZT61_05710 [Deltaproteobacteria bacterium]|nr:hypothetical protein [Deltaproteobacteria bacterium]MCX7953171.1 hypothetical protein [Deltaproteobacteria bacterium]
MFEPELRNDVIRRIRAENRETIVKFAEALRRVQTDPQSLSFDFLSDLVDTGRGICKPLSEQLASLYRTPDIFQLDQPLTPLHDVARRLVLCQTAFACACGLVTYINETFMQQRNRGYLIVRCLMSYARLYCLHLKDFLDMPDDYELGEEQIEDGSFSQSDTIGSALLYNLDSIRKVYSTLKDFESFDENYLTRRLTDLLALTHTIVDALSSKLEEKYLGKDIFDPDLRFPKSHDLARRLLITGQVFLMSSLLYRDPRVIEFANNNRNFFSLYTHFYDLVISGYLLALGDILACQELPN